MPFLGIYHDGGETPENPEVIPDMNHSELHPTIRIGSNDILSIFCDVGNGTRENPYIIENFEIDASPGTGINISYTDAYLVIRNCTIFNGKEYAISVARAENVIIENNTCFSNEIGICLAISDNITIIGNNCSRNGGDGINIENSDNILVANNTCNSNWIGIGTSGYTLSNHNISVVSNECNFNEFGGIGLFHVFGAGTGASAGVVENNTCNANNNTGIYTRECNNLDINNNSCHDNRNYGMVLHYVENSTMEQNTLAHTEYGCLIVFCSNTTIQANTMNENHAGVYLSHSNQSKVIDNEFSQCGFLIETSKGNVFSGTNRVNGKPVIYHEDQHDIHIDGENAGQIMLVNCVDGIIENVEIANSTTGMSIDASENIRVKNNVLQNQSYSGIYLQNSSRCTLTSNLANNNWRGLLLRGTNNSAIRGCNCSGNEDTGLFLYNSHHNAISLNTIANNGENGIHLFGANNNTIWINTIYDNLGGNALYFPGMANISTPNQWDNGTTGNYWGDYQARYPDAQQNGLVWSTPYAINGAPEQDAFPLVEPYIEPGPGPANDAIPGLPWLPLLIAISGTLALLATECTKGIKYPPIRGKSRA